MQGSDVSTACVFFKATSEHFGQHCDLGGRCRCEDLYGGGFGQGLIPHPDWPDEGPFKATPRKADFGCRWFLEWEALVEKAFADGQTAIVICADIKGRDTVLRVLGSSWEGISGIGHSQKAELAYLLGHSKLTVSVGKALFSFPSVYAAVSIAVPHRARMTVVHAGTCEVNPLSDRM
eukprot:COSAG01_NODE_1639_length_9653_cov_33.252564_6_plen_177_part_00